MSAMNAFNDAVSAIARDHIVGPIVEFLKEEHDLELSIEEVLSKLKINASAPSSEKTITSPAAPGPKVKRVSSKTTTGKRCTYRFTKGTMEGQFCGKPAEEGTERCKACKNKGKGKSEKTTSSKSKSAAVEDPPSSAEQEIEAVALDAEANIYREIRYNIILLSKDGVNEALGYIQKHDDSYARENLLKLDAERRKFCEDREIIICDDKAGEPTKKSTPVKAPKTRVEKKPQVVNKVDDLFDEIDDTA